MRGPSTVHSHKPCLERLIEWFSILPQAMRASFHLAYAVLVRNTSSRPSAGDESCTQICLDFPPIQCVCARACMCVCACARVRARACVHARACVRARACVHVRVCVRAHVRQQKGHWVRTAVI